MTLQSGEAKKNTTTLKNLRSHEPFYQNLEFWLKETKNYM
jgi:hypothetical protein